MSEVQGRPASSISAQRRYGIAISVGLILGGAYWALTSLTEEAKASQDHYPVQGTAVAIESSSADVEIRSGDVGDITIDRRFERNLFGSEPKEKYKNGKLEIRDTSCGFLSFGCSTHYVITVPKDVAVSVESTSGDLTITDLPGGAKVKTSSGGVEASRIGGELLLNSSSGDLEASELTATKVITNSSSGSVDLSFETAPQSVEAEASSGDVTVQVPEGTETYQVQTDTSSGDESANVRSDPAATRTIKAKTSSGDVTIEYTR
ncbi:putative adhesin [Kribbella amoyensis]|uniref:Putative adhesin n=1 Tax=Kribbella amoyensis TaxID=996641 RepID=A0A561BTL6_9ACTN|nr:DUF4097 family beta strand repeat-containing protein [Kribbella amoyensis]TWD82189.1 putative adhesin [Kribbella amoyensis]